MILMLYLMNFEVSLHFVPEIHPESLLLGSGQDNPDILDQRNPSPTKKF